MPDVQEWKDSIIRYSGAKLIAPTVEDMISSVDLPELHKDPFDRLLVAQSISLGAVLVTRDQAMGAYEVETLWQTV